MDGPVKTLREVMQQVETSGMVDFTLAGHEYSRPPAVVQGNAADQLLTCKTSLLHKYIIIHHCYIKYII